MNCLKVFYHFSEGGFPFNSRFWPEAWVTWPYDRKRSRGQSWHQPVTSNRSACLCQIEWPPSAAAHCHRQPPNLRHHLTEEEEDSSSESENISLPRVICHCPTCCPDHYTWMPLPPTPPPPESIYRRSASPRKKFVGRAPPTSRRNTSRLFTVIPQSSIDSSTSKCSCPVYDVVLSWQHGSYCMMPFLAIYWCPSWTFFLMPSLLCM